MKKYNVTVNGTAYEITIEEADASQLKTVPASAPAPAAAQAPVSGGEKVSCPMPGTILSVNVANGAKVKKGDVLFVLEAMKMENELQSPCDGTVSGLNVTKGAAVESGAVLCVIG